MWVLQGLHTFSLYLFFSLPWGLSPLFFTFFFSSLMSKMVPSVLQILILSVNRICQVREDVNGKLIEEQRVDSLYDVFSMHTQAEASYCLAAPQNPSHTWSIRLFKHCLIINYPFLVLYKFTVTQQSWLHSRNGAIALHLLKAWPKYSPRRAMKQGFSTVRFIRQSVLQ